MRRHDWVERLHACIEAHRERAFEWGVHDCARFASKCIDAITDGETGAELAAQYTDERSAFAFMAREGGLEAAVTRRLGEPVRPLQARRGDVVLLPSEDGEGLGVCMGELIVALRPDGFVWLPLDRALKAWRVD